MYSAVGKSWGDICGFEWMPKMQQIRLFAGRQAQKLSLRQGERGGLWQVTLRQIWETPRGLILPIICSVKISFCFSFM